VSNLSDDASQIEPLMLRAQRGDDEARQVLLATHRDRLCRMVALRLDRRLAARIDPSDVVQEALVDADQELSDYLAQRSMPFYAWLRRFAWDRLVDHHRRHVLARRRSVDREDLSLMALPDQSAMMLADRLAANGTSPSRRMMREESRQRVQKALAQLPARDREVLVLLYMEELSAGEIAAVLSTTQGAIRTRHVRALERLRKLMGEDEGAEASR
jgi:RNA polymerase sigma-70 factor, ECF subfamily